MTIRAINGFVAEELIDASRDADMPVVGSRGTGGFARLLMGVGEQPGGPSRPLPDRDHPGDRAG